MNSHPRQDAGSGATDVELSGVRVALVLASSTGGVGRHVRSLAGGLLGDGVDVTVLGPQATDDLFGFTTVGARFIPVEIAASPGPSDLHAIRELRRPLRHAEVVHAHGLRAGLISGWALGRPSRQAPPLVLSLHNAILVGGVRGRVLAVLASRAIRRADLVLGASSDLVAASTTLGARHARLSAVAAPRSAPSTRTRTAVRSDLGVGDVPLILAVGRLGSQKGYDVLCEAAARWRDAADGRSVLIAGDGPLEADLNHRIALEKLPMRLLGPRTDVPDLLLAADVVVLPSRWEARALVAQEALRAGVPLVAARVGGMAELVSDAAELVPAGDAGALADAVDALLADPDRRAALSAAGPRQSKTWPDEDATVADIESAYRQVLLQHRPG